MSVWHRDRRVAKQLAIDILEYVVDHPYLSARELAEALDANPTQTNGQCQSLYWDDGLARTRVIGVWRYRVGLQHSECLKARLAKAKP